MSYVKFDFAVLDSSNAYKILIGFIVPRPIAWISTISKDGITNLAPFSFFNAVCSEPPLVMVSFGYKDGGLKDTLKNILDTKELVINIAGQSFLDTLVDSAAQYTSSEIDALNIKTISSEIVKPPRIEDVPVQLECTLYKSIELGSSPEGSIMILAEVKLAHIKEDILGEKNRANYDVYDPIARLGGISYGKVSKNNDKPIPEPKS